MTLLAPGRREAACCRVSSRYEQVMVERFRWEEGHDGKPVVTRRSAASTRVQLRIAINQKILVLARVAYRFRTADALIVLAMLALGELRPPLPGRAQPTLT